MALKQSFLMIITKLLLLLSVTAEQMELDWTEGFRNPDAREQTFDAGTKLIFNWEEIWQGQPVSHDVVIVPTKEAFDACDFSEGVSLGEKPSVEYTITETTYFVCTVPGHCFGGQKLAAIVTSDMMGDESIVDMEDESTANVEDESMTDMEDELTTDMEDESMIVDCNEYQRSVQLDDLLRMDYVVYENENDNNELYMKAQLVLEEDGSTNSWIGFGIHEPGTLLMVPGEAVIGIPSANEGNDVFKYSLGGYSPAMVQKFPNLQQTLEETELIAENTTMTVMRFTKKLDEGNDELRIFSAKDAADQVNNFMWAYGFGNTLGYHRARGSFAIQAFSICDPNSIGDDDGSGGFIELDVGQSYPELFAIHGLLATIAWGVLSPLAIGSAMLRKYLTCLNGALWFKCHYYFNLMTFIFTAISFVIAVVAHQKSTPKGQDPKHFVAFAHATVGLIIMIFLLIQVFNGWFRPHPVSSPNHDQTDKTNGDEEDDNFDEEKEQELLLKKKKQRRSLWEYCHRIIGAALIGISWYQIHDGMSIYIERYNGDDYRTIFWSITGGLSGFIFLSYMCSSKPRIIVKKEEEDVDNDNHYRNYPTTNNKSTKINYIPGGRTNVEKVELYEDVKNGIEARSYNRRDSFGSC